MMKMNRLLSMIVVAALLLTALVPAASLAEALYTPGTYTAAKPGMRGDVVVTMTFDETSILSVTAEGASETPNIGTLALEQLPGAILEAQSAEVDAVTSATITSDALLAAAAICIQQAKGEYVAPEQEDYPTEADVMVLGAGASGLAAATAAGQAGASVIVLEAGSHVGGAAVISGGNITYIDPEFNMSYGRNDEALAKYADYKDEDFPGGWGDELRTLRAEIAEYMASDRTDAFDSVARIMVDHYEFCFGYDLDGNPTELDYELTKKAMEANQEIGQELLNAGMTKKVLTAETPHYITPVNTGSEQIAIQLKLAEEAGATIILNTRATELVTDETGRVVGAVATDANGETATFYGRKGVIVATGGFAANAEMCAEYQNVGTSMTAQSRTDNPATIQGDGILMTVALGAQLRNMQFVGLGTTDYVGGPSKPEASSALNASQLVVNLNGQRFWKNTSDTSAANTKAMTYIAANQPEGVALFIGDEKMIAALNEQGEDYVAGLKERGLLFTDDTLDGLAQQVGCDAAQLAETIATFNGYVDAGTDPDFGREQFNGKVENGLYAAFRIQISYHLTFGGIITNTEAEVLDADGQAIPGLYAAGDVTSGIEGSTHLTGDCMLACIYYGEVAGRNAAAN